MKIANKLSNKWWLLPTTVGLGLLMPKLVFAVDAITTFFGDTIMQLIMLPAWLLLQLEMWLLPKIAQYNNFINEPGVVIGWTALRDVSNMMFILVLLVIAFATILRVKSYGYKQLLSRLIIVAILINFSRTFVGLAIDLSQVVMLTFVQAIKDVAAENLIVALGLSKISTAGTGLLSFLASLILGAFMVVLAVVVIGVFIGMLAARVVTLWILIVLSPLAFLAYVFPRTQSYFNKWLSQLGSNLFSGPVLVFFLWLAFTITGRGDIYKSFIMDNPTGTVAGVPITDMSTAASPSNVMNYVIAMVLLVSSLKFVGASGAAGASLASKAHKGATDYASKLARRYPGGMLSRAGAGVASRFITSSGAAKRAFGIIPSEWSKIPFVGGRIQRAAMTMQGYDAARIQKEKEEDTKYVKPGQKAAFYKSQKTLDNLFTDKIFGVKTRRAAQVYSTISSLGGNIDKDALAAQHMLDRGEINETNAEWATNHLRRIGDDERREKIQAQYLTYQGDECERVIEKRGLDAVMGDVHRAGILDTNGKYTEGAKRWARAIVAKSHGKGDPNTFLKEYLKNDKNDRWKMTDVVRDTTDWSRGITDKENPAVMTENGFYSLDKKGIVALDFLNEVITHGLAMLKVYPNKCADVLDPKTGKLVGIGIDKWLYVAIMNVLKNAKVQPGMVASKLRQWHGETDTQFKERQDEARELDGMYYNNPQTLKHLQGKFATEDDFEKHRQARYRQLIGVDDYTEDKNGGKRVDWYDDSVIMSNSDLTQEQKYRLLAIKYTKPEDGRKDLAFMGETLSKETPEGYAQREEVYDMAEDEDEYRKRVDAKVQELMDADQMDKPEEMSDEQWGWAMARKRAQIVGNKRKMFDLAGRTMYVEAADGGHGSRAAEIDFGNPQEAQIAESVGESMEQGQQAELLRVATDDQMKGYINIFAKCGKVISKALAENVSKDLAAEAFQEFRDVSDLKRGVLSEDLGVVGPDPGRWLGVLEAKKIRGELSPVMQYWLKNMQEIMRLHGTTVTQATAGLKMRFPDGGDLRAPAIEIPVSNAATMRAAVEAERLSRKSAKAPSSKKSKPGEGGDEEDADKKSKKDDPTNPGGKSV